MRAKLEGARLSALKLSQLSWFDRRWVLNQLSEPERTCVKNALSELKKLNIANKAELLSQLLELESHSDNNHQSEFVQRLSGRCAAPENGMTTASQMLLARCVQASAENLV